MENGISPRRSTFCFTNTSVPCHLTMISRVGGRGLLKFWWILKRCLRGTYSKLCRQGHGPRILFWRHTAHWEAPTLFEKNLQYTDNSAGWQVREIQSKLDTSLYIIYIYNISFIYAEQSHSEQTPGWSPQNVVLSKGILPTCPSFRFWNHSDIVICLHAGPLPVINGGYKTPFLNGLINEQHEVISSYL